MSDNQKIKELINECSDYKSVIQILVDKFDSSIKDELEEFDFCGNCYRNFGFCDGEECRKSISEEKIKSETDKNENSEIIKVQVQVQEDEDTKEINEAWIEQEANSQNNIITGEKKNIKENGIYNCNDIDEKCKLYNITFSVQDDEYIENNNKATYLTGYTTNLGGFGLKIINVSSYLKELDKKSDFVDTFINFSEKLTEKLKTELTSEQKTLFRTIGSINGVGKFCKEILEDTDGFGFTIFDKEKDFRLFLSLLESF